MSNSTDILHEAKRLRLLAAALELQHYTSTAANVVPIPGGDQVIAIGTPAQVRGLLAGHEVGAPALGPSIPGVSSQTARDCIHVEHPSEAIDPRLQERSVAPAGGELDHSEGGHHD